MRNGGWRTVLMAAIAAILLVHAPGGDASAAPATSGLFNFTDNRGPNNAGFGVGWKFVVGGFFFSPEGDAITSVLAYSPYDNVPLAPFSGGPITDNMWVQPSPIDNATGLQTGPWNFVAQDNAGLFSPVFSSYSLVTQRQIPLATNLLVGYQTSPTPTIQWDPVMIPGGGEVNGYQVRLLTSSNDQFYKSPQFDNTVHGFTIPEGVLGNGDVVTVRLMAIEWTGTPGGWQNVSSTFTEFYPKGPVRVSVDSQGTQGNGASATNESGDAQDIPSVSADGRFVAFTSSATNLVPGDTNGRVDVFVHDRLTGQTERVSVANNGTQGAEASKHPSISADGRYVAFMSWNADLVGMPGVVGWNVFRHDRRTHTTTLVSESTTPGTPGNGWSGSPSISADGRYVAFNSASTNLAPGTVGGAWNIFVRDCLVGFTTLASVADNGTQQNPGSGSDFPSISADGRFVAFESNATNLVAGVSTFGDIFVRDRQTNRTVQASVSSTGAQGIGRSFRPSISADGRYVAFFSDSSNLVPGDTNNAFDFFVHDLGTGQTERVNVNSSGAQSNGDIPNFSLSPPYSPSISGDGRYVAFYSDAIDLVPGDSFVNAAVDVFVRDRLKGETRRLSVNGASAPANGHSHSPSISADGRTVAFVSIATNLSPMPDSNIDPKTGNNAADVFVVRQSGPGVWPIAFDDDFNSDAPGYSPSLSPIGPPSNDSITSMCQPTGDQNPSPCSPAEFRVGTGITDFSKTPHLMVTNVSGNIPRILFHPDPAEATGSVFTITWRSGSQEASNDMSFDLYTSGGFGPSARIGYGTDGYIYSSDNLAMTSTGVAYSYIPSYTVSKHFSMVVDFNTATYDLWIDGVKKTASARLSTLNNTGAFDTGFLVLWQTTPGKTALVDDVRMFRGADSDGDGIPDAADPDPAVYDPNPRPAQGTVVVTYPAANVTAVGATLGGTVFVNGLGGPTFPYFQLSNNADFSNPQQSYPWGGPTVNPGDPITSVSYQFGPVWTTMLAPGTTYHYRVVAQQSDVNGAMRTYGNPVSFTTPEAFPTVSTLPATNVTDTSAALHGMANPHLATTNVYFQVSDNPQFALPMTLYGPIRQGPFRVSPIERGEGDYPYEFFVFPLQPGTTYYYRIVAINSGNERSDGNTMSFTATPASWVGPSGNDTTGDGSSASPFGTIQHAIDNAAAGSFIRVLPGTYNENIRMKSGVSVVGSGPSDTVILGQPLIEGAVNFNNVRNATLRGFTISVSSRRAGYDKAVMFQGLTDQTASLVNCIIRGTQYGIMGSYPAAPTIQNNTLDGGGAGSTAPGEQGINFNDSYNFGPVIRNNIVTGYFYAGIHLINYPPQAAFEYNDVWGNGWGSGGSDYLGYPSKTGFDGNISASPMFVAGGYNLASGSPCINAGGDPAFSNRTSNVRTDMGAYGAYVSSPANVIIDTDQDGVPDSADNCPTVFNPPTDWVDINGVTHVNSQPDFDLDGVGDACDNCPQTYNPPSGVPWLDDMGAAHPAGTQVDTNRNGIGDVCDTVANVPANEQASTSTALVDTDGDGVPDALDNCPNKPNPTVASWLDIKGVTHLNSQPDFDLDGMGDACDPCPDDPNNDVDRDGICVGARFNPPMIGGGDNCPDAYNPPSAVAWIDKNGQTHPAGTQVDFDQDGVGDACDPDRDGDGVRVSKDGNGYYGYFTADRSRALSKAELAGIPLASRLSYPPIGGPDCNDSNPNVNPGMKEIPGNGIDDDCNPATFDSGTYGIVFDWVSPVGGSYDTWLPTGDNTAPAATVKVNARAVNGATNTDVTGVTWSYELVNVTKYPGKYTNDTSTATDNDFTFSSSGSQLTFLSNDYGGSITVRAIAKQAGAELARNTFTLPKDTNGNGLPDAWENLYNANGALVFNGDVDRTPDNAAVSDGLTNFEEYRGFKWGRLVRVNNDNATAPGYDTRYNTPAWIPDVDPVTKKVKVQHIRTNPFRRDLFIKFHVYDSTTTGKIYGYDPYIPPAAPDNITHYPFAIGEAFRNAGIDVWVMDHATAATLGESNIDVIQMRHMRTGNVAGADGIINKVAGYLRNWTWDTKGWTPGLGNGTVYAPSDNNASLTGISMTYLIPLKNNFDQKPYTDNAYAPTSLVKNGKLDWVTKVADVNDTGSPVNAGGDEYVVFSTSNQFQNQLSPFDVNGNGRIELPLQSDPDRVDPNFEYTRLQVLKHTITHELGHAVGSAHTTDAGCLMYGYTINYRRDMNFGPDAQKQIQIHNN